MLQQLKMLLGIASDDDSKDDLLIFILDTVTDMVLNYCDIEEVPDGLERIIVRMARDMYKLEGYGQADTGTGTGAVTQVKRGDTTVSYGSAGSTYNSATGAGGADFINNYVKQLNAFRQVTFS